jgi:putative pyruvate formate lyase activating enzyme
MVAFRPAYLDLLESGELDRRAKEALAHLENCDGCAWHCGVNRHLRRLGICRTGARAMVSSYGAHMGEEPPLSGQCGSGTIFFTRCSLSCQFCQNHEISQNGFGVEVGAEELAGIMLELQQRGCHNINLVTPSHLVPQIIQAVAHAARKGLRLPIVYNSGGYDSLESLRLLDGLIDIYMPDMKYAGDATAHQYSLVNHYATANQAAVMEMHRQVGDFQQDEHGTATRGLLVRHLVLPNGLAGTGDIARFLAEKVSPQTYLHLMDQYQPAYKACKYPELNRRITREEFAQALDLAVAAGLRRLIGRESLLS